MGVAALVGLPFNAAVACLAAVRASAAAASATYLARTSASVGASSGAAEGPASVQISGVEGGARGEVGGMLASLRGVSGGVGCARVCFWEGAAPPGTGLAPWPVTALTIFEVPCSCSTFDSRFL
jgi:hypothetical protein